MVEKGWHTYDGKEICMKFPDKKEEETVSVKEDSRLWGMKNACFEKHAESHGSNGGLSNQAYFIAL